MYLDITASAYQTGNVRTTLTLDDDVYEAVMHLSRASGERFGKLLSALARRALKGEARSCITRRGRFPTFSVPPDAPVIPASRIQRAIHEEGLF
jgi:hypothetical protein